MEGFVSVYISQAGDEALIEQQRFELPAALLKLPEQPGGSEILRERFGTQVDEDLIGIRDEPDSSKLARVGKDESGVIRKVQEQAIMFSGCRAAGKNLQIAAHAQVDEQIIVRQVKEEKFPPAVNLHDLLTGYPADEP